MRSTDHGKYDVCFTPFALERTFGYLMLGRLGGKLTCALFMVGVGFYHLPVNDEPPQLFFAKEKSNWVPVYACVLCRKQHAEKSQGRCTACLGQILQDRSVLHLLAFTLGSLGAGVLEKGP